MSGHQTATLEDTVYFWFGANDTSGSGGDGASPVFDVREAGAAAGTIPLLSGSATLLSHANYPAGCHEIAIAATAGNGFAADDTFAVFCTLLVDSQNPTGFVGSCTLTPLSKTAEVTAVSTKLDSDIVVTDAKLDSDMTLVLTQHTKTQSDVALIDAAIDSDMVLVVADHDKTQSDIVLISAKLDSDMTLVLTQHTKTQSDVALIDAAIDSDVILTDAKIDSDMTLLLTQHTKTQSDVALVDAAIDSDALLFDADHDKTQSDIALIDAAIDSDMTLVLAQHTKTQSDIVIIDDFLDTEIASLTSNILIIDNLLDTEMAAQTSNLVIIASDTVAIEVDTNSLNDGSISELAQGAPSATPTLQNAVMLLYMALRNKLVVQTSGTDALEIYDDAGTKIAIKLIVDDGSDYTEDEMTTGA